MIQPVNALTPKVFFKGELQDLQPMDAKVERNIALINASGISTAIGAVMTAVSRSYTSGWKSSVFFGLGAAALSMMFLAPHFVYKARINTAKSPEVDTFIKEAEAQKKFVNDAIDSKGKGIANKLKSMAKKVA